MRRYLFIFSLLINFCLMLPIPGGAAENYDLGHKFWPAKWIDVPGTAPEEYGVYHFRRAFALSSQPERFLIHVSGDNRYQLYVNGVLISWGPARSDLAHWRYETVDIAPQLRPGQNLLAAVVWNDGPYRAVAQVTNRTGFVVQADQPENAIVNTNSTWKCLQDKAYFPRPLPPDQQTGYYALAANEEFHAKSYPWGWEKLNYDDSHWQSAHEISNAAPRDSRDGPNRWMLVPRYTPLEEQTPERSLKLRKTQGTNSASDSPSSPFPIAILAHMHASFLFDQTYLTTAYPELTVSNGRGAKVTLRYAETLYLHKSSHGQPADKGNRNDIEGKAFYGPSDLYVADGGKNRLYRPLFWRTYRYLRVDVDTADEPLAIETLRGIFTAYPFHAAERFEVADPAKNQEIQRVLTTGWRTARLCAHETYMDCPFYEQLQYAGDARIQMMISLYMTGDSRLMKNGISLLNWSRTSEGATYSRAPSYLQQYIPPFSLWWIGMVHDYWMYVDDPQFVKEMLPGVRAVLSFYQRYQKSNGSLGPMPWWNFVDWVKQWANGVPPADSDGGSSAALDLQFLMARQWAAGLENALGDPALSREDKTAAEHLKSTILATDWDPSRGLFADQPSHRTYSQQVNTLAVLAGVVTPDQGRDIMRKVIGDTSLAQCSIYFRAYMNATLRKVGLGGTYLAMLGPWREMLNQGLTTWAEWNGLDARSDCHAWGASPNFEMARTIAGIESAAPGFQKVRIAPHLGDLKEVRASIPHHNGPISIHLTRRGSHLHAHVNLPGGLEGNFVWNNQTKPLRPGKNQLEFDSKRASEP